ncbi:GtrA family protein [Phreatobacter aquaticus]|uniref:GtrA family protein n=1 Tax=Phreatobacter aquaticus TaxID=2570229 RepID=A0A4D7QQ94_9HYPH|nr:GtrA family protein [Phreatobacter aquaticus]QCK88153.1 GtrA family protein [Phreatobacter aquaticus]
MAAFALNNPFVRFVLTGGFAAGVNVAVRILLSMILSYELAVVLAYLAGMTTAYILMRAFVFDRSGSSTSAEFGRFAIVNLVSLVQVWIISVGLARWIFPAVGLTWHAETIAHVIGVLSPVITSYLGHRAYTFGRRTD